jgi:hypothetical protein
MLDKQALHKVVFDGVLRSRGMPNFKDVTPGDLEAVQHFIRREAHKQQLNTP